MMTRADAIQRSGWILLDGASSRVSVLGDSLFSRAMAAVSMQGDRLHEYQPWMSGGFLTSVDWPFADSKTGCPLVLRPESVLKVREAMAKGLALGVSREAKKVDLCPEMITAHPESKAVFEAAWSRIAATKSTIAELMHIMVHQIIPIKSTNRGIQSGVSSSTHRAIGAIFVGLPRASSPFPVLDVAISIAHELGHQVLMLYQRSDRLISKDLSAPSFSGTRGTSRPVIMALHAAVALAFMAEAARQLKSDAGLSEEERHYLAKERRDKVRALGNTLRGLESHRFTDFGLLVFQELKSYASYYAANDED